MEITIHLDLWMLIIPYLLIGARLAYIFLEPSPLTRWKYFVTYVAIMLLWPILVFILLSYVL